MTRPPRRRRRRARPVTGPIGSSTRSTPCSTFPDGTVDHGVGEGPHPSPVPHPPPRPRGHRGRPGAAARVVVRVGAAATRTAWPAADLRVSVASGGFDVVALTAGFEDDEAGGEDLLGLA